MLAKAITRRVFFQNATSLLASTAIAGTWAQRVASAQSTAQPLASDAGSWGGTRMMAGKNLLNWHCQLGDASSDVRSGQAPNVGDITIVDATENSSIYANIARRDIVAHNISCLRIREVTAFDYLHHCQYKFRIPYQIRKPASPSENPQITDFAETIEGGLFCWDGLGTQDPNGNRYDYGLGYQIVVNPFDDLRGPKYLFDLSTDFISELDNSTLSDSVRGVFAKYGYPLSAGAAVTVYRAGNEWAVSSEDTDGYPITYLIYRQGDQLRVNQARQWGRVNVWNGQKGWLGTDLIFRPIDTEWHTVDLIVSFQDKMARLLIDGIAYPAVLSRTPKEGWGNQTDARLQVETVSKHPEPEGVIATSTVEVKDWLWNWHDRISTYVLLPLIQGGSNLNPEQSRITAPVPQQTITLPFTVIWEEDADIIVQLYQNEEVIKAYPQQRSGVEVKAGDVPLGTTQIKIWRPGSSTPDHDIWCEVIEREERMVR
mgnify:CR=1 FL=1